MTNPFWKVLLMDGVNIAAAFSVLAVSRSAARFRLADLPDFKKFHSEYTGNITDVVVQKPDARDLVRYEGIIKRP